MIITSKKFNLGNSVVIVLLFVASVIFAGNPTIALAVSKEPQLSEWMIKRLNKVNEYLAKDDFTGAQQLLDKLLVSSKKTSDFDLGMSYQAYGYAYALQQDRYLDAIASFEKALPGLAESERQLQKTRFDLGQLYMAKDQFANAITVLNAWTAQASSENAQVFVLLASAHSQLNQDRQAIAYLEQAIQLEQLPQRSWYELLLALYSKQEQWSAAESLLKSMLQDYPKHHGYWKQLAVIQLQRNRYAAAAASFETSMKYGLLTGELELLRLASLYQFNNTPNKAQALLMSSLTNEAIESTEKNWNRAADAALLARDETGAIKALKMSASLSSTGEADARLAYIYLNNENFGKARRAIEQALSKGSLKNTGETHIIHGTILNELGEQSGAVLAFEAALEYETVRERAVSWLNYLCDDNC